MQLDLKTLNKLIYEVNGAAMEVHQQCMKEELNLRGISFQSEMIIPVKYKEKLIDTNLRLDLLVERILPVELKAVEKNITHSSSAIIDIYEVAKTSQRLVDKF